MINNIISIYFQHGILYFFICIIFASLIDNLFPKHDKTKARWKILLEIILQLILIIFIMEQVIVPFVRSIPLLTTGKVSDFPWFPAIIIATIYVGSQRELREKIKIIQDDLQFYIQEKPLSFIP
jgi:hypothetical protein